ncbi:MAG: nuclear transport factor 2 family protein [Gluconacetobacter diazotrophicus]|nr:nuclear transport factor 2 family protein [Gluconacetobacter diazotrophicus]
MADDIAVVRKIYDRFNARDIDGVLDALAPDVSWANGMEGGHVHGHRAVRDYWFRQWAVVSPHVEPVDFITEPDGSITVEVRQSLRDPEGRPIEDPVQGLENRTIRHGFRLRDGKVSRFDIRDDA